MDETIPHQTTTEVPRASTEDGASGRALAFARRHPALTVIGVAGAGLIGGVQLMAGVLIGAGIAAYVRAGDRRAAATAAHGERERTGLMDRISPEMKKRARAMVQAARGRLEPAPATEPPTTGP
jgi:hypothetical protein